MVVVLLVRRLIERHIFPPFEEPPFFVLGLKRGDQTAVVLVGYLIGFFLKYRVSEAEDGDGMGMIRPFRRRWRRRSCHFRGRDMKRKMRDGGGVASLSSVLRLGI